MSERLDQWLVLHHQIASRSLARRLILDGCVKVDGTVVDKPSRSIGAENLVEVLRSTRYVSRGGEKLKAAIDHFDLRFSECSVLDVGASTGGFTDCVLQHGAASVTCVDVGTLQLHPSLLNNPRVANLEHCNARDLDRIDLPLHDYDWIVVDVSFISLKLILPSAWNRLKPGGHLLALVKPQFEAGRAEVARGKGVVKDDVIRQRCLEDIIEFTAESLIEGRSLGFMDCPVHGGDGNREFFLLLKRCEGDEQLH